MTKLLIVDDEPYIRHGLRHTIHWEEHGIEIVGEATNGEEALKTAIATPARHYYHRYPNAGNERDRVGGKGQRAASRNPRHHLNGLRQQREPGTSD